MTNSDLFNLGGNPAEKQTKVSEETSNKIPENQMEESDESETANDVPQVSELDMLKQRARLMGISFSNNISPETLAARIQAKLDGEAAQEAADNDDGENDDEDQDQPETQEQETPEVSSEAQKAAVIRRTNKNKKMNLRQKLLSEAMKLVRVRVTNLDPKKKDLPGEIITVANEYIGTVKKYVPFGEVTENGWHVPYCIYRVMERRKFLSIKVTKRQGREHVETQWAREFALEVLPPLTESELARLAAAQTAKGGLD